YINYKVTGFYFIILNLIKPFYNNVFFKTLYYNLIAGTIIKDVTYRYIKNTLIIDFIL
ncbi:hypothetical protein QBC41DRAFT_234475, partial [Cercophora samala]